MNFVENELEIHFTDRDKDDGKDVLCKLELPFNDQLIISFDSQKFYFKI